LAYDFVIKHLKGTNNPANDPSRPPDCEMAYDRPVARLFATVRVEPYDDLMPAIFRAQAANSWAVDISANHAV
jgi:hypothetical protein